MFPMQATMTAPEIDLTSMRVFHAIVEAGSFAAAADRLGMAPPMVSKHMARLERALGARLLHRTSRSMRLTEAGTAFHEQSRQALELLDAATVSVGQGQQQPQGELRISAPVWCATPRFAALLADYRRACPAVRLDLHLDNHMVDLVSGGFDVALRMTAEPAPQLIARPLCAMAFHWVAVPGLLQGLPAAGIPGGTAAPAVPAASAAASAAAAPPPLPVILPNYVSPDRLTAGLQQALGRRIEAVMQSSDTTLSYHAAQAGIGAAFMPAWLVEDDLAHGRLLRLPVDTGGARTLHAVYASRRQMPLKLRSFIDFLAQRLAA